MKTDIYLISENFIRNKTNISTNVNSKFILSSIKEAQLEYEMLIGTSLYNKIVNLVDTDSIKDEENVNYKTLLDKSQYYIAYIAITRLIPMLTIHYDNFGASQQKDEHIEPIQIKDMFKMVDYYKNESDTFKRRIQNFLLDNYKDYPELNYNKVTEFNAELRSSASTSIFLGGARSKGYYHKSLKDKYENKIIK